MNLKHKNTFIQKNLTCDHLTINNEITDSFKGGDEPVELNDIVNKILKLEDGGFGNIKNQDAIEKLIEGILEKSDAIKDEEFIEWCRNYEG